MLRVHLHRQPHQTAAPGAKRISPAGPAAKPREMRACGCGYRLEAAARRVGVYSRFERDQDRG
jgi:hypothetical protein